MPPGTDDFEVLGSFYGHPAKLVKCETSDLEVPACCDVVLEGTIDPAERRSEGPFGDHTVTAMQDWGDDVIVGTETYGEAEGTAPGAGSSYVARWNPSGAVRWKR